MGAAGGSEPLGAGGSSLLKTGDDDRRLVALDVDGTLMTYDEFLSDEVREAVSDVRAAGHHVVLATGRPLVAALPVARDLGIDDGWLISSNGSVTVRLDAALPNGFAVHDVVVFDPEQALLAMHEHMPLARIALEEVGVGYWVDGEFPSPNQIGRASCRERVF